jgi:hypothetical protein
MRLWVRGESRCSGCSCGSQRSPDENDRTARHAERPQRNRELARQALAHNRRGPRPWRRRRRTPRQPVADDRQHVVAALQFRRMTRASDHVQLRVRKRACEPAGVGDRHEPITLAVEDQRRGGHTV